MDLINRPEEQYTYQLYKLKGVWRYTIRAKADGRIVAYGSRPTPSEAMDSLKQKRGRLYRGHRLPMGAFHVETNPGGGRLYGATHRDPQQGEIETREGGK